MKKNIIVLIFGILFVNCNSQIKLLQSTKQTVLPGRRDQESYTNFIFKFSVKSNASILVDSVTILMDKKCYKSKYILNQENTPNYIDQITKKGNYILELPIQENNISLIPNCIKQQSEVVIHYKKDGILKKMQINNFIKETVTRR
jgi:hypothetical protein